MIEPSPENREITLTLPKWVVEFYAPLARKNDTTVHNIFVHLISQKAESDRNRVELALKERLEQMRADILDEIDVGL